MRSDVLVVASPDRLPRIECRGGVAARITGAQTVHLVSTAATPLGGDSIAIRIVVENTATLNLRSAAATVVLPATKTVMSHSCFDLDVEGSLDLDLEPTVVAANSRHVSDIALRLGSTAAIRLRERIQIGRSGEREGFWAGSLRADIDGRPLLRHRVELGAGSVADDAISTPLAMVSELRFPATEIAVDAVGTELTLAAGGTLTTWQGHRL